MAKQRTYMCIDMKSFFASVECAERGLNPFETNLIVADETRGNGTIYCEHQLRKGQPCNARGD